MILITEGEMMSSTESRKESRLERSDRIAREIIVSERRTRERKTARLRALRMEMEKSAEE